MPDGKLTSPPDPRELDDARTRADEALREYAALLKAWNAPDDEHTRFQVRSIAEWVVREVVDAR